MPLSIPLQAVPNQTVAVQLGGQNVNLNVYTTSRWGLFMDVYSGGSAIATGVSCQNLDPVINAPYLGFAGDFVWLDNTGNGTNPTYDGIGTDYSLIYLTAADLASEPTL